MLSTETLEIPALSLRTTYRIVFDKQRSSVEKNQLPLEEQKHFEDLYSRAQENPEASLEPLLKLKQKHPQVPEIANLLAYAYLRLKKKKEAEELIEKTYHDHPNYLIAKINFADQCLRLGKLSMIPVIFQGATELYQLYPEQTEYHYAEFRGFHVVMGFYYFASGEKQRAENYYQLAFQVDPLHPSVIALENKLSKVNWLKNCLNLLQRLAGISKKH